MSIWLVRGGKNGEFEDYSLNNDQTTIGWPELPDLSNVKSKDELYKIYEKTYPDFKKNTAINHVGQVWAFINKIHNGDYIVMPLKRRSAIAIGEVRGPYAYRTDLTNDIHHVRRVKWIKSDIPRTAFDQDILYSLGAFMTVCQIQRNNAEQRILEVLNGKNKPGQSIPDSKTHVPEKMMKSHQSILSKLRETKYWIT